MNVVLESSYVADFLSQYVETQGILNSFIYAVWISYE